MPINLIKAITNQTKNSFVVSSFIYIMNDHEKCVEALNVVEKFQYELSLRRHTPIPIDRVEERLKEIQEILES